MKLFIAFFVLVASVVSGQRAQLLRVETNVGVGQPSSRHRSLFDEKFQSIRELSDFSAYDAFADMSLSSMSFSLSMSMSMSIGYHIPSSPSVPSPATAPTSSPTTTNVTLSSSPAIVERTSSPTAFPISNNTVPPTQNATEYKRELISKHHMSRASRASIIAAIVIGILAIVSIFVAWISRLLHRRKEQNDAPFLYKKLDDSKTITSESTTPEGAIPTGTMT